MQDLKVTIVQPDIVWEDKKANLSKYSQLLDKEENTDLIVLPEMFPTGFSMEPEKLFDEPEDETLAWMQQLASQKKAVVTGSVIVNENNNFFNRLYWVRSDGSYETYDKKHLFSMANEQDHYSSGQKKLIVSLKEWKICPMVCYDLRFPVWIRNKEDYDLLVFVANWPERRVAHWIKLLQARAIENQCYVVGVNRVGNDGNGIYHSGDSIIVDPMGEERVHVKHNEQVVTLSLTYDPITKIRKYMPFLQDRDEFSIR